MLNTSLLKYLIPIGFGLIILFLLYNLNNRNQNLAEQNQTLSERIAEKDKEVIRVNAKNDDFAATLKELTEKIGEANKIASDEARRRAAAEMKNQKLQEEVKDALKDNRCASEYIPHAVSERMYDEAVRIRGGKSTSSTDTRKSTQ